jgi:hypothetical protein
MGGVFEAKFLMAALTNARLEHFAPPPGSKRVPENPADGDDD